MNKSFYSALLYKGMPSLSYWSIQNLQVVYEGPPPDRIMSTGTISDQDLALLTGLNGIYCLDIEKVVNPTLFNSLSSTLNAYVKQFGYYNLPTYQYNYFVYSQFYYLQAAWRATNEQYLPSVAASAALFPSLYTFYNTPSDWVNAAVGTITEAKRLRQLAGVNIPILPFIWPQYHPSSNTPGAYIDSNFWKIILQTVTNNADGFVLWGGYNVFGGTPVGQYTWDPSAAWWQVTANFINSLLGKPMAIGYSIDTTRDYIPIIVTPEKLPGVDFAVDGVTKTLGNLNTQCLTIGQKVRRLSDNTEWEWNGALFEPHIPRIGAETGATTNYSDATSLPISNVLRWSRAYVVTDAPGIYREFDGAAWQIRASTVSLNVNTGVYGFDSTTTLAQILLYGATNWTGLFPGYRLDIDTAADIDRARVRWNGNDWEQIFVVYWQTEPLTLASGATSWTGDIAFPNATVGALVEIFEQTPIDWVDWSAKVKTAGVLTWYARYLGVPAWTTTTLTNDFRVTQYG